MSSNAVRVCNAAGEIVALLRTLVLFHYDSDARRLQSQFDRYLRVINDAFHDIWSPSASSFSTTDVVLLNC